MILQQSAETLYALVAYGAEEDPGAGIADHLHYHVVPRWGGDTNFMPVVSDTKVMVQHLGNSWDLLRGLYDERLRAGI